MPTPDWNEILGQIAAKARDEAPEIPFLDEAVLPQRPAGIRGRVGLVRRVDDDALTGEIDKYQLNTVNPIHDTMLSGFQLLFDRLAGKACPLLADNVKLVNKANNLAKQYGFEFFYTHDNALLRAAIGTRATPGVAKLNAAVPSALAGVFTINLYGEAEIKPVSSTNLSSFPGLIVARDLDQAKQILAGRNKDV